MKQTFKCRTACLISIGFFEFQWRFESKPNLHPHAALRKPKGQPRGCPLILENRNLTCHGQYHNSGAFGRYDRYRQDLAILLKG